MKIVSPLLIMILIILSTTVQAQEQKPGMLLPSEALILMYNAVDQNPDVSRIDNTLPYLERVITTNLSSDEQFYLGEVYFWDFKPKEAEEAYKPFLTEDSKRGRSAWQRTMQIKFRAYDLHEEVETDLKKYRRKFKPIPADRYGLFGQVYNVASLYQGKNEHEKVIQLIEEELSTLNHEGAYRSFQLPAYFIESYKAVGKNEEAIQLLQSAKSRLEQTLADRMKSIPEDDHFFVEHGSVVTGMDNTFTEEIGYQQMNKKFEDLIESLAKAIEVYQ